MLMLNPGHAPRRTEPPETSGLDAMWIDLLRPDAAEIAAVEQATGLRVPLEAELAEIESSSRLGTEGGALYFSMPSAYLDAEGVSRTAPLGLVLSARTLITVRFAELPVFDIFAERFARAPEPCSAGAFLGLLEAIVDRLADVLEHVSGDLEAISRRVFRMEGKGADVQLRATLRGVGRAGERLSNIRDSLLGVQRIVAYTEASAAFVPAGERPRLPVLRQDVASLAEYDVRLSDKVQFLLDATLGFINIEQNNGIKVLTVVSVVGVPPTLMASIYGMNFKAMPELQWQYGYVYGLAVIVASGLLPLIWFRRKGWI